MAFRTLALIAILAMPVRAEDVVDRLAVDALKAWQVPGLAIAIVKDGQPLSVKAFGIRELGKPDPLTVDDAFPLASCTKAFTATLIAQLADEGKLDWDEPVRKHLPAFHLSDPNADALVSLRDLLTHRTGVNGHDLLWYRAAWSHDEIISRIARLPLSEPFRGEYQYSTLMYLAAGKAASSAAGKPWEAALREKLIEPLGMKGVTFTTSDPAFLKAPKASGHHAGKDGKIEVETRYEMKDPNPAGSLNLTIGDMVPWLQLHLNGGTFHGKRLVSAANLGVTHSPQIVIPIDAAVKRFQPETVQLSYAMGWIVSDYRGVKLLAHGGMIDGFRTQIILVPDRGLGIALFNNLHDNRMNQALGNALVDHFLGLPPKDWNAIFLKATAEEKAERKAVWEKFVASRQGLPPATLPLAKYAGTYTNPAYGTAKIVVKDGKLHWEWSSFRTPLEDWGSDVFRCTESFLADHAIIFKINAGGVESLFFEGMLFRRE